MLCFGSERAEWSQENYNKLEYQTLTLACIKDGILIATKMTFVQYMIQQHRISCVCASSIHFDNQYAPTSISKYD